MTASRIATSDLGVLQDALESFNETAGRLEEAYRDLEAEKRRIDLELESRNRELADTVASLDTLLASLPAGVVGTDAEGAIRTVNQAAERILGIRRSAWLGRLACELLDAEGQPLLGETELGGPVERVVRLANGDRRVLSISASRVLDPEGCGNGILATFTDVTETCALRDRLAQRDRMAEMGEMAAVLAHQIRNPLNGIAGFGRLIRERVAEERTASVDPYAARIVDASGKLEELVGGLLRFAREDSAPNELVPLDELIRAAVDTTKPQRVRLAVQRSVERIQVRADRALLREALRNLIDNALEASVDERSIRVHIDADEGKARVRIHDAGPGMDAATLERVFRPFFTTKEKGTGLGLPIARKVVERHGGRMSVRSAPGAGCRVTVELPLADEEEKHDDAR